VFFISFFIGREREKRESEKKNWGARGKHILSLENSSHKKEEEREEFWFLIPRGALALFIILQNFIRVYHDRE
jgi:hypothetical protein